MAGNKKKKVGHKSRKVIPIPFPVEELKVPPEEIKEIPETTLPVEVSDFEVCCEVEAISTHFFSGGVFVALKAADGQDLLALLRRGQKVTLHYKKEDHDKTEEA